jgi:hypothetical protein
VQDAVSMKFLRGFLGDFFRFSVLYPANLACFQGFRIWVIVCWFLGFGGPCQDMLIFLGLDSGH